MRALSQADLEQEVLRALYDFIQTQSGRLNAEQVAGLLNNEFSEGRVKMALQALERARMVRGSHNAMYGSKYEISESGFKEIEAGPRSGATPGSKIEAAPGSDRVVGLDHNSRTYLQTVDDAKGLKEQLLVANDVGDLSPRQVQVAAHEVGQIIDTLQQEFIRPAALWQRSTSVLGWIGKEAAAAMVGAAALALLALIAHLLGIVI